MKYIKVLMLFSFIFCLNMCMGSVFVRILAYVLELLIESKIDRMLVLAFILGLSFNPLLQKGYLLNLKISYFFYPEWRKYVDAISDRSDQM